jgi:hypothetical protein
MRVKRREIKEDRILITTAELPPEMIARSTSPPSLLAHVATDKFCDGAAAPSPRGPGSRARDFASTAARCRVGSRTSA